jgi:hypothetical protein
MVSHSLLSQDAVEHELRHVDHHRSVLDVKCLLLFPDLDIGFPTTFFHKETE